MSYDQLCHVSDSFKIMKATLAVRAGHPDVSVLGTRYEAVSLRRKLDTLLADADVVQVEFGGVLVTQSFADELLGPIVLRMGPEILQRISFSGCIEDTKDILRLVLSGRLQDYATHRCDPLPAV